MTVSRRPSVLPAQEDPHAAEEELAELRNRVARQEAELAELRRQVGLVASSLSNRQDDLEVAAARFDEGTGESSERAEYLRSVQRLRRMVEEAVPVDARVVVAGKGVEELVRTLGRQADHLGRVPGRSYPSFHPNCGRSAIAQLEAARWDGADYFLIPQSALWWLDHYADFAQHLIRRYRPVAATDPGAGSIWSLRDPSPWREVDEILELCFVGLQRRPVVLDWHTGSNLTGRFPESTVFSPVDRAPVLPYLDESIDVVAVRSGVDAEIAEARRVASSAVVVMDPSDPAGPSVLWSRDECRSVRLRASIVLHASRDRVLGPVDVARLLDSLPSSFQGEILVASETLDLPHRLGADGRAPVRTKVVRTSHATSRNERLLRAAETSTEEVTVFVAADARPVPGWLSPLVGLLDRHPTAAATCGMLVEPDGRLVQGGGGTVGPAEYALTAPSFGCVRTVGSCSTALLAVDRRVFLEVGGFGEGGLDFCGRVQARGRSVVYQPETVAVVNPDV